MVEYGLQLAGIEKAEAIKQNKYFQLFVSYSGKFQDVFWKSCGQKAEVYLKLSGLDYSTSLPYL